MKTISIKQNATADDIIAEVGDDDVLVLRDGKPVAMLSPFDEDDLSWYVKERDPRFLESLERARKQIESGDVVTHDELKKQLGIE